MKKNQFALLFLTAVIMLAVWYVKSPFVGNQKKDTETPVSSLVSRFESLQVMRQTLREERSLESKALDEIIASSTTTVAQKNQALLDKQAISDLTESEVLLEISVMNLGYADAFVHKTQNELSILVVADELTQLDVIDIMNEASKKFVMDSIIVTRQSPDELVDSLND